MKFLSNLLGVQKFWKVITAGLLAADLAYLWHNPITWAITLGFFLLVPGYLVTRRIKHELPSKLETAGLSLGLSLLLLMGGGLLLNALHSIGVSRPLDTVPVFVFLNALVVGLLWFSRKDTVMLSWPKLAATKAEAIAGGLLTLLPLLAIGGAIRLNNGASNVLTMVLFAAVAVLFVVMAKAQKLVRLYPYAIFMFGVSVLLATSLRGWFITGHDIRHEFIVFQQVSKLGYWSTAGSAGDPYNACLSITILPTILEKITAMPAAYIFKALYQVIFAFSVLPVYFLAKRMSSATKAFIAAFVFVTFPAFLSDMSFLNRQEIAFVFFGLLGLITFSKMAYRVKAMLTIALLWGIVLSHYSSSYVMLGLLVMGLGIYKLLTIKREQIQKFALPVLSFPILLTALLFTFFWNAQVTATTGGLQNTIKNSISGLIHGSANKDGFTQYSLVGGTKTTPEDRFDDSIRSIDANASYVKPYTAPLTGLGRSLANIIDVQKFNNLMHTLSALALQGLLAVGVVVVLIKNRRSKSQRDMYFGALAAASLALLAIVTLMPQLSVDYSVIRLFQQILILTALPIVLAAELLSGIFGKAGKYVLIGGFAVLFINLSGFMPQALGGFRPQLSLNNSGAYYDYFYGHQSDVSGSRWLADNKSKQTPVFMDTNASSPILGYKIHTGLVDKPGRVPVRSGYLFQNYANTNDGVYRAFISGDLTEYKNPSLTGNRSLIYSNGGSAIYGKQN